MALAREDYDALVVGTGFGGAVAACRLAQAGLRVGILERGRRWPPGSFPRRYAGRGGGLAWQPGHGLYDVRPLQSMVVVQAAGYGGGSLIYANVQMRPPAAAFAEGWPAGYDRPALDPYYDLVAHMLDVAPVAPDPADGRLPPKTRVMDETFARLGRPSFHPNLAVTFAPGPTRNRFGVEQAGCVHCGECDIGCNVGAKNTLDLTYLVQAERHGAEVSTLSEAIQVASDDGGYRVAYRDHRKGGGARSVQARQVFLCLGAVNTTELLLRCRDEHGTLPGLSGRLGHGYSGNGDFLAFGLDAAVPFAPTRGPTITTAAVVDEGSTWFVLEEGGYSERLARRLALLRPGRLARLAWPVRAAGSTPAQRLGLGRATNLALLAMGRDRADGRIELVGPRRRLRIRWDTAANLPLYTAQAAMIRTVTEALGARLSFPPTWARLGRPTTVHNLGGCPMGDEPARGVVDGEGRVFGYPGLHVLDGAILPRATGVNPSHTIAAVAERNVERAVRRITGNARWTAPEAADAPVRTPPEDLVAADARTPAAPVGAGLRWSETMRGWVERDGDRVAASFAIHAAVVDFETFLADPEHSATVGGRLWVDGVTGADGAPLTGGRFQLFVAGDGLGERRMRYDLRFQPSDDDREWAFRGTKPVRGRNPRKLWRALTTLDAAVTPADEPAPQTGRLRIGVLPVLRMVLSARTTGAGGPPVLLRFGWSFAANVARIAAGR